METWDSTTICLVQQADELRYTAREIQFLTEDESNKRLDLERLFAQQLSEMWHTLRCVTRDLLLFERYYGAIQALQQAIWSPLGQMDVDRSLVYEEGSRVLLDSICRNALYIRQTTIKAATEKGLLPAPVTLEQLLNDYTIREAPTVELIIDTTYEEDDSMLVVQRPVSQD